MRAGGYKVDRNACHTVGIFCDASDNLKLPSESVTLSSSIPFHMMLTRSAARALLTNEYVLFFGLRSSDA
jgi:hypothetical protein